jgi:transcription initiation factor IIE alpha subunit
MPKLNNVESIVYKINTDGCIEFHTTYYGRKAWKSELWRFDRIKIMNEKINKWIKMINI